MKTPNTTISFGLVSLLLLTTITNAQTPSKNYIRTQVLMVAEADTSNLVSLPPSEKQTTISYTDGLGRSIQTVAQQISPLGNDLVDFTHYDSYGRQPRKYLEFTQPNNYGNYTPEAQAIQLSTQFHQTLQNVAPNNFPYIDKTYQKRPGKRVLEQGAPGAEWQLGNGHTTTSTIQTNTHSDAVWLFKIVGNNAVKNNNYSINSLTKSEITDPNGHTQTTFKDTKGRLILKRNYNTITQQRNNAPPTSIYQTLNTYYIYDDYDRLRMIIPPNAAKEMDDNGLNQTNTLTHGIYKTTYDHYGRPVEKTIPNAGTTYYIYNKAGQVIATQDEENRANQLWKVNKYDIQGRIVYTALHRNADSRIIFQTNANQHEFSGGYNYEGVVNSTAPQAFFRGYTNQAFPLLNDTNEIMITYSYDDYDYNNDGIKDADYATDPAQEVIPEVDFNTLGLLTGTQERVLNQSGINGITCPVNWITTTPFYDKKENVVYTYANNALGGTEQVWEEFDFAGNKIQSKSIHTSPTDQFSQYDQYDYVKNRLTAHWHRNGKGQLIKVAAYTYNELGEVVEENRHQNPDRSFLQSFDKVYDEQRRLTDINHCSLEKDRKGKEEEQQLTHLKSYITFTPSSGKLYQTNKLTYRPLDEKEDQCNEQTHTETQFIGNENHFTPEAYQDLQDQSGKIIEMDLDLTLQPNRPYNPVWRKLRHDLVNKFHGLGFNNPEVAKKMADNVQATALGMLRPKGISNDSNDLFGLHITYTDHQPLGGNHEDYGNNPIAICSQNAKDAIQHTYEFNYDDLGRLTSAPYAALNKVTGTYTDQVNFYALHKVVYDLEGNIEKLVRKGQTLNGLENIDDLHYTYEGGLMTKVEDRNTTYRGIYDFHDGASTNDEYQYNSNGFLIEDKNKGIIHVEYDHNNLPIEVVMNRGTIKTLRTAGGTKLKEEVYLSGGIGNSTPDKATIFTSAVYKTQGADPIDQWSFVPASMGRIVKAIDSLGRLEPSGLTYRYEYTIKDQLENTRVVFSDIDNNGSIDPATEVLETADYRPFGMAFELPMSVPLTEQQTPYRYNGKEFQDELSLNWSDYGLRQYDAAIGRWMGPDPMAEKFASLATFNYAFNSPIRYIDPDGTEPTEPVNDEKVKTVMNELGRPKRASQASSMPARPNYQPVNPPVPRKPVVNTMLPNPAMGAKEITGALIATGTGLLAGYAADNSNLINGHQMINNIKGNLSALKDAMMLSEETSGEDDQEEEEPSTIEQVIEGLEKDIKNLEEEYEGLKSDDPDTEQKKDTIFKEIVKVYKKIKHTKLVDDLLRHQYGSPPEK